MKKLIAFVAASLLATPAAAQGYPEGFTYGPVFENYGPVAEVELTEPLPADASFRHSFDIAAAAEPGEVSRQLESVARFINMHARAGVPVERIQVAVVVHGRAGLDLMHAEAYAARHDGAENANLPLIAALIEFGVPIYLCGQSAAGLGIANADLAPGVQMALSAMTAHALLQQRGYTVNPF
ncbi:DsrE family protein [Aurantiacibacter sp. MUD11]|uniref:DsrE family protein n=1 Tax=Aurantiacibacter sp. MUD11 TaxID=3003265 RepID=UPI0022AA3038|nr:DsrE family protein [Aurantiacibacter sp. MUD11]WAT16755.1 DsrE family protein [Aurantiacibacter sp. MUD11]